RRRRDRDRGQYRAADRDAATAPDCDVPHRATGWRIDRPRADRLPLPAVARGRRGRGGTHSVVDTHEEEAFGRRQRAAARTVTGVEGGAEIARRPFALAYQLQRAHQRADLRMEEAAGTGA